MTNIELYRKALDAINALFSDQSVSQGDARNNLQALRSEIDIMLDTLEQEED